MIQKLLKLKRKFAKDKHLGEMAQKSAYSFGMRVLGLLINYLFLFFVTHYYGAKGWGVFALCFSMLQIASMIGTIGINVAFVKLIPQGYGNLKQLYNRTLKLLIPFNILLTLLIFFSSHFIGQFFSADGIVIDKYMQIASLGILPFSISIINSGVFRGNKEIVRFSFYDSLGRFLWGGLCASILHFFTNDVYSIITGFVIGLYILSFISFKGVHKILDRQSLASEAESKTPDSQKYSIKELVKLSLPLFWSNFIMQGSTWATTLIIGIYLPKQDVGMFDASNRLANLLTIVLYAVNSISAPKFAEFAANKQLLEKNVQHSSKLIFIGTIPLFVLMLIGGPFMLNFLEHQEINIQNANLIFFIILFSQLINNLSGSVTLLMQMTGYHKVNQNICLLSFIFTTSMLFFVTPVYGLIGASLVTGLNIILKNIASVIVMYSRVDILTVYSPTKKDLQWLVKRK
jgi:O-antigen/teichoic acid export membrane protein